MRIDADIVAWLRNDGEGYQTRLNDHLRKAMKRELERETASDPRLPTSARLGTFATTARRAPASRRKAG